MASETEYTAPTLRLRPREMTYKNLFVRKLAVIAAIGLVGAAIIPSSQHRFVSVTVAFVIVIVLATGCFWLMYLFLNKSRIDITPGSVIRTDLWGKQHKFLAKRIETSVYVPRLVESKSLTGPVLYLLDINGKRLLKLQQDKWASVSIHDLATRVPAAKYETIKDRSETYVKLHKHYSHYPGLAKYFEVHPVYGQFLIGLAIVIVSVGLAYRI